METNRKQLKFLQPSIGVRYNCPCTACGNQAKLNVSEFESCGRGVEACHAHTRYQHGPSKMHQTATALGPKTAIEPGHIRHSLQLPRPPIGPAASVTNVIVALETEGPGVI